MSMLSNNPSRTFATTRNAAALCVIAVTLTAQASGGDPFLSPCGDGAACGYSLSLQQAAGGAYVNMKVGGIWCDSTIPWARWVTWEPGRIDLVMTRFNYPLFVETEYCTQATSELIPAGIYDIYITIQTFDYDDNILSEIAEYRETITISSASCGVVLDTNFDDDSDTNFYDATLTGWTHIDDTFNGVGAVELADGKVRLFTTDLVTPFDEASMLIVAESMTDPEAYADGTLRIGFRASSSNPYVAVGARLDDPIENTLGYAFNIISSPSNALILQRGNGDGTGTTLASVPFTVSTGVNYEARASFIGAAIEMTVWVAGDPEPEPQIAIVDANPYLYGGQHGVLAGRSGGVGLVDVSFDNARFTLPDACPEPCPADLTGDGLLSVSDVAAWLQDFSSGAPAADFNNDGVLSFSDVQAFLAAFNAGCP